MSRRTRVAASFTALLLLSSVMPPPVGAGGGVLGLVIGVCWMEATVTFDAPIGVTSSATGAVLAGDAQCRVDVTTTAIGTIAGNLDAVGPVTCVAGVLAGSGSFSAGPDLGFDGALMELAYAGPAAELVVAAPPSFAGAGAFVRDQASLLGCGTAAGGVSTLELCGVFAFEDPEPPIADTGEPAPGRSSPEDCTD